MKANYDEVMAAKTAAIEALNRMPEGNYVTTNAFTKKLGLPKTYRHLVGCWISKHPRAELWGAGTYVLGGFQ